VVNGWFRLLSAGVASIRYRLGWESGNRWPSGGVCDRVVLDPGCHVLGCVLTGRVDLTVHEFVLQDRIEGLGSGIVEAATDPAHGLENPMVGHHLSTGTNQIERFNPLDFKAKIHIQIDKALTMT